jgi:hypothetical protein
VSYDFLHIASIPPTSALPLPDSTDPSTATTSNGETDNGRSKRSLSTGLPKSVVPKKVSTMVRRLRGRFKDSSSHQPPAGLPEAVTDTEPVSHFDADTVLQEWVTDSELVSNFKANTEEILERHAPNPPYEDLWVREGPSRDACVNLAAKLCRDTNSKTEGESVFSRFPALGFGKSVIADLLWPLCSARTRQPLLQRCKRWKTTGRRQRSRRCLTAMHRGNGLERQRRATWC